MKRLVYTMVLAGMSFVITNCAPGSNSQETSASQEESQALTAAGFKSVPKVEPKPEYPVVNLPKEINPQPPVSTQINADGVYEKCEALVDKKNPQLGKISDLCTDTARAAQDKFLAPFMVDKSEATKKQLEALYAAQQKSISVYNSTLEKCYDQSGVKLTDFIKRNAAIAQCFLKATGQIK